MWKKILAVVLTAALLLSGVTLSAAADTPYSDIKGHWAEAAILRWTEYGIINGSQGKFKPNNPMTRGEFAKVLVGVLGLRDSTIENTFTDLPAKSWYTRYMLAAVEAGILSGDGKGHVMPNNSITREQAMTMLARAISIVPQKTPDEVLSAFSDGGRVGNFAKVSVSAMVDAGYVNGTGKNMLSPKSNITRASVIALLDRLFPVLAKENTRYTMSGTGYVAVSARQLASLDGKADKILVTTGANGAETQLLGAEANEITVKAQDSTLTLEDSRVQGEVRILADNVTVIVEESSSVQEIAVYGSNVTVRGDGVVGQVTPYTGSGLEISAHVAKINNSPLGVSPLALRDATGQTDSSALVRDARVEASAEMDKDGIQQVTVVVHGSRLNYHLRENAATGKTSWGYWSGIALTAVKNATASRAGAGTTLEAALRSFNGKTTADKLTKGVDPTGKKNGREIAVDLGNTAYGDTVQPGGSGIWAVIQWYSASKPLGSCIIYHICFDVGLEEKPLVVDAHPSAIQGVDGYLTIQDFNETQQYQITEIREDEDYEYWEDVEPVNGRIYLAPGTYRVRLKDSTVTSGPVLLAAPGEATGIVTVTFMISTELGAEVLETDEEGRLARMPALPKFDEEYEFVGWLTEPAGGVLVDPTQVVFTQDTTLYISVRAKE